MSSDGRVDPAQATDSPDTLASLVAAFASCPFDEVLAARLVRAYAAAGERGAAIAAYQTCERSLRERDAEPGEDLVAAYRETLWNRDENAASPSALPKPATRFVGRERELRTLIAALRPGVTVVLVGPAGVGKTRLAIRAGEIASRTFADGVRYVEAAAFDAASLADAVHGALAGDDAATEALVILDNAEHVVEAAAAAVRRVREDHPRCALLVTSRARIDDDEARIQTLAPLDLPLAVGVPELVARAPAVSFFLERAVAARPSFSLVTRNVGDVIRLCAALDGIPLALELAAAQIRFLTPAELLARLRTRPDHHGDALLRDEIAGSWALLDPHERRLAQRLAVFDRRWTLEEAEAIGGAECYALLTRLVDRSLVTVDEIDGSTVYRYLETTYAFARERLEAAEDVAALETEALRATRDAIVARTAGSEGDIRAEDVPWLRARLPTIRRALDRWSVHDPQAAIEIGYAMRWFFDNEGLHRESVRRVQRLVALVPRGDARTRYALLRALGGSHLSLHELPAAREALLEALAIAERDGDRDAIAETRTRLAIAHYEAGEYDDALGLFTRVADDAEPGSNAWAVATAAAGNVACATGDFAEAERRYDLALHVPRGPAREAIYMRNRAFIAAMRADRAAARAWANRALEAAQDPALGENYRGSVYSALGFVAAFEGAPADALRWYAKAVVAIAGTNESPHVVYTIEDAANALGALQRHRDAVVLHAAVACARERAGTPPDPSALPAIAAAHDAARRALGERAYEEARAEGTMLDVRRAAERVLRLAQETAEDAPAPPSVFAALSPRENEVALLVGEGKTNREIADALCVSVKTVENHVAAIFSKLDVSRRAQVAALVTREAAKRP